jgi:hypothetical protein
MNEGEVTDIHSVLQMVRDLAAWGSERSGPQEMLLMESPWSLEFILQLTGNFQ